MISLAPEQLQALRTLRKAYPKARIALIGAAALGFHMDMKWRNTSDLDLVIAVEVSEIDERKLAGWIQDRHNEQRWVAPNDVLIDLVPAPLDALAKRELVWARTKHKMSLEGVSLALDAPTEGLNADLAIAIPSVPIIALLKMAAYTDQPFEREKDLTDLAHILNEYPPVSDDRLYTDEMLTSGLDTPRVQATVLGRELKEICNELDREIVVKFLELISRDEHWSRFVRLSPWRNDEDNLQRRIDSLREGFAPSVPMQPGS